MARALSPMTAQFFNQPILNSPYAYPGRHWELDPDGQPTNNILEARRKSAFITPVPKPRKRRRTDARKQSELVFADEEGISTPQQQYDPNTIINQIRGYLPDFIVPVDDSLAPIGGLEPLGKRRKEFAGGEGPIGAQRAGASESLGRGEVALGAQVTTPDFLNLIVEIRGFRGEDAKEKANTIRTCWVPGVNNLGKFGRWAFAGFRSVFDIAAAFDKLIQSALVPPRRA